MKLNQSAVRTGRILRLLATAPAPLQLCQIARALDVQSPTAHLLMQSLRHTDLVEKNPQGHYRLGVGAMGLGGDAQRSYDLRGQLAPPMKALASTTRETVSLTILHRRHALIVMRFESDHYLCAVTDIGTSMPLESACGRCLAAWPPPDQRNALNHAQSPDTPEHRALLDHLDRIREDGYAAQRETWADGVSSIAMPVLAPPPHGAAIASLGIVSPTTRFAPDMWIPALRETTAALATSVTRLELDPWLLSTLIGQTPRP